MAGSRGKANQSLYRARILLDAWDRARDEGVRDDHLLETFLPAVRLHLREAYGWFLLAVSGHEEPLENHLPVSTTDIPAPELGRARSPELQEFAALEGEGWLAQMLEEGTPGQSVALQTPPTALLGSDREAPGYAVARDWSRRLAETMARMDDSLNEC